MKFTATAVALGLATAASAQLSAIPIIEAIAPGSKSCAQAEAPDECREAPAVAHALVNSFFQYGIYSVNAMASLTALMAFESVDFAFKRNIAGKQGNADHIGQGTANMQMSPFNLLYAQSIPALAGQFSGMTAESMSDADKIAVLDALQPDEYSFGSGAWFLLNHGPCSDVPDALAADADSGFLAHMGCVGVSATEDRLAYWTRAKAAFGI